MNDTIPSDDTPRKQCTGPCGRILPATSEFFRKNRGRWMQSRCRKCENEHQKLVYKQKYAETRKKHSQENREKYRAKAMQYRETHREEIRIQRKQYRQKHREEINARQRQRAQEHWEERHIKQRQDYLAHQEERIVRQRLYRETHREEINVRWKQQYYAHRDKRREQQRQRYQKYREERLIKVAHYRKAHLEKVNAREKNYRREHRERYLVRRKAATQRRRSRKRNAKGELTAQQIQDKLKAQKYACYYEACSHAKFEQHPDGSYIFHLEHTIPLSRPEYGPRHDVNFVVLACPACNLEKHNKLPHEWPEGGRLL